MSVKTAKVPSARRRAASAPRAAAPASPDIFDYLDYRAFLRDFYVEKKRTRGLSFRGLARRANLRSPNYFKLVMDGDRNLTLPMAERFAQAAGLDESARSYFCELVSFNQATTSSARAAHYARLIGFRRYRKARPLDAAQAAYHSTWYLPAVRELAASPAFRGDPDWIARTLWPSITPAEAARAVETLLELGLLLRDEQGEISQGDALLSTGPEVESVHIANYHRMMLTRAAASIDEVPAPERDISALTLCLGKDGLRRLKERIVRFRRELLELSTLEASPEQVVQVNFQLFPLTRLAENRSKK